MKKMNVILENWHKYLSLSEDMGDIDSLSKKFRLNIVENKRHAVITMKSSRNDQEVASIYLRDAPMDCIDAFEVLKSEGDRKLNRILHEIALEYVGQRGIYISKENLGKDIESFWEDLTNSREDVDHFHPLDFIEDSYQNNECIDLVIEKFGNGSGDNPYSHVFVKLSEPKYLPALQQK